MEPAEVTARVAAIEAMRCDNESAHAAEDDLWRDVLSFIAQGDGASLHVQLAREALKTEGIDFTRWYA